MTQLQDARIAIVGLGYVGLPLAVEFGKQYATIGFDINPARITELRHGRDSTLEVEPELLAEASKLTFTDTLGDTAACNVYIVTVPTPIDAAKRPDLTPLVKASEAIGKVLKPGDTVIYESTVYPGCTEEVCVPILERVSGLTFNARHSREEAEARHSRESGNPALPPPLRAQRGGEGRGGVALAGENTFAIGYSPERINPGDKAHRVTTIKKVTSGSTPQTADFVDALYASIITAGTHKAPTIKVAEAAKVIENTQRDLNIALVNDLAILFNKLGIDTLDVLEAAGTKWNFLPFRPGLVGGHCISVDPYYLTHKAQEVGHHPQVILAGRRTNDGMGPFVADQVIKLMLRKSINPVNARILILGLAFKENCPDLRNTRVVDIIETLRGYNANVEVYDPWVDAAEAQHEYGITPSAAPEQGAYDAVIVAVGHHQFCALGGQGVRALGKPEGSVVFDVKYVLPRDAVDARL
ncbi:nucleotide sugar dehydrogenase [Thermomonas paludicola]|uniref:nucleotide sugar dehydrogenase n=1 Tax=Thermomonas paludicola TaxID=2884874 RepID=UPI002113EB3A|nr:nucleotide sugar dehydrogenase [Thermomonas paludicola]